MERPSTTQPRSDTSEGEEGSTLRRLSVAVDEEGSSGSNIQWASETQRQRVLSTQGSPPESSRGVEPLRTYTHGFDAPSAPEAAPAAALSVAPSVPGYLLPRNPRAMAPSELGVWMELQLQTGSKFLGSRRTLGEFYVIMDRRAQTAPGASPDAALASNERNLHRAQPTEVGSLRWYDNDGPHKRQIDAIDMGFVAGADVSCKFKEVPLAGEQGWRPQQRCGCGGARRCGGAHPFPCAVVRADCSCGLASCASATPKRLAARDCMCMRVYAPAALCGTRLRHTPAYGRRRRREPADQGAHQVRTGHRAAADGGGHVQVPRPGAREEAGGGAGGARR